MFALVTLAAGTSILHDFELDSQGRIFEYQMEWNAVKALFQNIDEVRTALFKLTNVVMANQVPGMYVVGAGRRDAI